jgi:hypothetical protein
MSRKISAIALAIGGAVLLVSGAADPQQPRRHRPDQQPNSECTIGSVEERLECLGREVGRQRVEIFMLRMDLESLCTPRLIPLF